MFVIRLKEYGMVESFPRSSSILRNLESSEKAESGEKADEGGRGAFALKPYRPFQYMKKPLIIPFAGFLTAAEFDKLVRAENMV